MSVELLAIDLGKRSFHIHGVDSDGVIISRKTSRAKLIETITELAPETIAMEACASAHYWGRRFLAAGRRVLLINPRFVKPFVKGSKIGIGGRLAASPLPHHRAYGSVPRRFDRVKLGRAHGFGEDRANRNIGCAEPVGPPGVLTCARIPSANRRQPLRGTSTRRDGATP
jgi:hypothetical protein